MILPAAGQGKRFSSGQNKIFAKLGGKSLIHWCLELFQEHESVGEIVVVASEDETHDIRSFCESYPKVKSVVKGGETRYASVESGLAALSSNVELVLVHDAARPLVSPQLVERIIQAAWKHGAAVPGFPLSDTLKRIDSEGFVRETIDRNSNMGDLVLKGLTAVQTPQAARRDILQKAYSSFPFDTKEPTDEASLLENYGCNIMVVPGDLKNIKITRQEDLAIATQWIGDISQSEIRTGFGYDVHAFASPEEGRSLYLGGVKMEHDRGLAGHSDADVLLHAVCDALLGAACLGDIGILFPNTDSKYRNISSILLLKEVADRLTEAMWEVVHIDATVVAEAPRILPYRQQIQSSIAESIGISSDRVSVKATTSEQLGFVGRREGIEASSVATIRKRY